MNVPINCTVPLESPTPSGPSAESGSGQFGETTDVEPYPVRLGTRYHDGKPGQSGKDWWGTVTGFQARGSLDFHYLSVFR